MLEIFRAILRGLNWLYRYVVEGMHRLWQAPIFLFTCFLALVNRFCQWAGEYLFQALRTTISDALTGWGLPSIDQLTTTGFTGFIIDCLALDVLADMVFLWMNIIAGFVIGYFTACIIKWVTRLIP